MPRVRGGGAAGEAAWVGQALWKRKAMVGSVAAARVEDSPDTGGLGTLYGTECPSIGRMWRGAKAAGVAHLPVSAPALLAG
jgi:hypothetical protein